MRRFDWRAGLADLRADLPGILIFAAVFSVLMLCAGVRPVGL